MKELIFATNNNHKLTEIQELIGNDFIIRSLHEIGCTEDIAETAQTLEGNALLKAEYIYNKYGKNCFADDTGLEVEALDGRPGVYSARYAGNGHDFEANIDKLLSELDGIKNRKARFRTVIALIFEESVHYFEGIVNGVIIAERRGSKGFGYDPVFMPEGYENTFAEMSLTEKNKISHRAAAVQKLAIYLDGEKQKTQ
jgi:XTP/dITP diphosphohydrolase